MSLLLLDPVDLSSDDEVHIVTVRGPNAYRLSELIKKIGDMGIDIEKVLVARDQSGYMSY